MGVSKFVDIRGNYTVICNGKTMYTGSSSYDANEAFDNCVND